MSDLILSPSQFEAFDSENQGCERRWAGTYSPGGPRLREPGTSATQLGTRLHAIAEEYHLTGKRPNLGEVLVLRHPSKGDETFYPGQLFYAGVHLNPPPKTARVEGSFQFTTSVLGREVKWRGTKDLEWIDPKTGLLWVIDHKTTSDYKYEKTAAKLVLDTQANVYAQEAIQRTGRDKVGLRWLTYHKYKVDARSSEVVLSKPRVEETVAKIERKAHRMLDMYAAKIHPNDAPPNTKVCQAYGKTCIFSGTQWCKLGETTVTDTDMHSFMAHVNTLTGGAPPPPPPPPPPAIPPGAVTPAGYTVTGDGQLLRPVMAATPPPAPVPVLPPPPPPVFVNASPADALRPNDRHGRVEASDEDVETIIQSFIARGHSREKAEEFVGVTPRRPKVEVGMINPPEASGLIAMASPEEMNAPSAPSVSPSVTTSENAKSTSARLTTVIDDRGVDSLDTMTRDELKKLAVSLGVMTQSDRFGEPRIRELIRKAPTTREERLAEPETLPLERQIACQKEATRGPGFGEQLEAGRAPMPVRDVPDFNADDSIRTIIREELARYFGERFGK